MFLVFGFVPPIVEMNEDLLACLYSVVSYCWINDSLWFPWNETLLATSRALPIGILTILIYLGGDFYLGGWTLSKSVTDGVISAFFKLNFLFNIGCRGLIWTRLLSESIYLRNSFSNTLTFTQFLSLNFSSLFKFSKIDMGFNNFYFL
jgi:hypothetical protein